MEGTRHERATLVGLAYFLGFLTTFIWLGIDKSTAVLDQGTASVQSAAVMSALSEDPVSPATSEATISESVVYQNGLLEVTTLGETRVLSFNPEISGAEVSEEFATQGTHVGEIIYTASPSDEYVFFCEQKSVDAKTCLPFVYDSLSEKIYPLRKDGDRVELLITAAATAVWEGNQLSVGGELSPDSKAPWLLGLQ